MYYTHTMIKHMSYLILVAAISTTRAIAAKDTTIGTPAINSGFLPNPLGTNTDIIAVLGKVLDVMVSIGFPILILALVYTGFLFVKAQGSETEITRAKQAFLWTVVGGVVLLGASIFAEAIGGTINAVRGV